jgi:Pregnancy-associated plasma protein-A
MKFVYLVTTIKLLSSNLALHSTHAHIDRVDYHDESYKNHIVHDESVPHHHFDTYHKYGHRLLRNNTSTIMIGNQTYADKDAFIKSGNRCGSRKITSNDMAESTRIVAKWMSNLNGRRDQATSVEVQTYFHVITDGTIGDITDSVLQDQLNELNDAFREFGFSFLLMGTTRTENADWYIADAESQEQLDMKTTLRVGDASTLNVYFNQPSAGLLLGYATFPSDYAFLPENDGVVILTESVPGGDLELYNEGKTLVHEVGHWLGLYHTFEADFGYFQIVNNFLSLLGFGCNGVGDGVDDTPHERTATSGCPIGKDSCPRRAGLDPINNYMDYSDDTCLTEFTPAQSDRMAAMWNEYRA